MICLVNLVIFFNVHSIKFSEICFKNKLFELINMAIIKNMRFAVCHGYGTRQSDPLSCALFLAHGKQLSEYIVLEKK